MSRTPGIYAALAAALLAVVDARNLQRLPRATSSADYSLDGTTPKPTLAPGFHNVLLRQAQSSSVQTAYIAPDNTCGFISGLAGAGYTCESGGTCVFFTSSTAAGHVACCNTAACNARLTCIDYNQYYYQSACNVGCAEDTFTLKCTQTASPYCNTLSFPGDIIDVFCNNVNASTIQAASTTYTGQSSRYFTPIALTGSGDTTSPVPGPSFTNSGSSVNPTGSGNGGDNGGDNGSNNDGNSSGNNSNSNNSGGSKTSVGAIVGGAVGGVAALGLIGLAAFFFLRKKNKQPPQPQPEQTPPAYQSPPMQQNQPGFYDPKFGAAGAQQPYPPPNQQQYDQQYAQPGVFYAPNPSVSPDQHSAMSPTDSHMDPRLSQALTSTSPAPSGGYAPPVAPAFQPQQGVIHEAPAQPGELHRGQMHELA